MKIPERAMLLLNRNQTFPIEKIHFGTRQVTLKEKENVFNTVSFDNVIFDYTGFSNSEINIFLNNFSD